jgi:hypothetical protein
MTFVVRKVSPPRPLDDVKNQTLIQGEDKLIRTSGVG